MDKGIVSFGQHYLENVELQNCLVESGQISEEDFVIEIGAGDGRITRQIAKRAGKVVSYEIDKKTKSMLDALCLEVNNVEIRFENFLNANLPNANKIVASLPYQITEPFLEKVKRLDFERITLLVGKNFGQFADENKNHQISKLLLLTRCYFKGEYICDVAKENFCPPPNTMSSIINLFPIKKEQLKNNPPLYIMREVFEQRDKKVGNALREGIIRFYAAQGEIKTKREIKQLLQENFANDLIDCYLEQMNNNQIDKLYCNIKNLF